MKLKTIYNRCVRNTKCKKDNKNKGKEKVTNESSTSTKIQWQPVKTKSKFKNLNEKSIKKENVYTSHNKPNNLTPQLTKEQPLKFSSNNHNNSSRLSSVSSHYSGSTWDMFPDNQKSPGKTKPNHVVNSSEKTNFNFATSNFQSRAAKTSSYQMEPINNVHIPPPPQKSANKHSSQRTEQPAQKDISPEYTLKLIEQMASKKRHSAKEEFLEEEKDTQFRDLTIEMKKKYGWLDPPTTRAANFHSNSFPCRGLNGNGAPNVPSRQPCSVSVFPPTVPCPNPPKIYAGFRDGVQESHTHYYLFPNNKTEEQLRRERLKSEPLCPTPRPVANQFSNSQVSMIPPPRPPPPKNMIPMTTIKNDFSSSSCHSNKDDYSHMGPTEKCLKVQSLVFGCTTEECRKSLTFNGFDVDKSVRHLKVEHLMNLGVKSKESCIEILKKQGWNLQSSCKFVMDRKRHKLNNHTN